MKITVVGAGYVGLSNAVLFAHHNDVVVLDVDVDKVNLINQKNRQLKIKKSKIISPIKL